jgi:hypothetical protein
MPVTGKERPPPSVSIKMTPGAQAENKLLTHSSGNIHPLKIMIGMSRQDSYTIVISFHSDNILNIQLINVNSNNYVPII